MRTLFLRIFLWFWLAMAVIVGVLVVLSPYWTRSHPAFDEWEQMALSRLGHHLDVAADHLLEAPPGPDDRGPGGDRGPGAGRGPHGGPGMWRRAPITVVARDGTVLDGPPPSPLLEEAIAEAWRTGDSASRREGLEFALARPATTPDGEAVVIGIVAGSPQRPPRPLEVLSAGHVIPRLALIVVLVGVLSWWLSRWLTSPMRALRHAARQLAGGDLEVRVDPRVTRRHDELGELARDFDAMAARLGRLVGAQRQLLRDVSHELRSPLARQMVALELARQRAGEDARDPLDRVEREAGRLEELIGRLLTLSRLEAGEGVGEPERFDLAEVVRGVAADADFEARAGGRAVTCQAPPSLELRGTAELVRSAVENVVRNAVRFTAEGSSVEVGVGTAAGSAVVTVADRGPGVPEEALERIFEPFARVEAARERGAGGAGLGLAIADRAVRLHGGTVAARNRDGGGLEIELRLPLAT